MCTEQWRSGVKLASPSATYVPFGPFQPGAWKADRVANAASRPRTT
eukprot:IDg4877t1